MEKDCERLVMFKQLPFHIGVKCMEQSVLEVDEAVREFSNNSTNPNPLNLSSWKFPQVKLEKLDIGTIIRNLRNQNLPGDIHYVHLSELLIDRLYFSILNSIRFVTMLTSVASDGDFSRLSTPADMGPDGDYLTLSIVNPLCGDTKILSTNMAVVIKHLQILLSDLETVVHQLVARYRKFDLVSRGLEENNQEIASRPVTRKAKSCLTQTEIKSIECCEVCTISQDAIKSVGESLELCHMRISPNEPTNISGARLEISKSIYSSTQWGALNRWCEALSADADTIARVTLENLKRNADLEQEVKKTTHLLNTNTRDHQLTVQKLEKKCTTLEFQVQQKKKEKLDWTELQAFLEDRSRNCEKKLAKCEEEFRKEMAEKVTLQASLSTLEKTHQELKSSQTTASQTLRKIQKDLQEEQKYKENSEANLMSLEAANRKYRLEIAKLRSDVAVLANEKSKVEIEMNDLRAELAKVRNEAKNQKDSELVGLRRELKMAEQKIELLTLYPDLNGSINTPQSENENILETLENQLRGNTLRVQILLQQSESLATTIKKLKGTKKNTKQ